MAKKDPEFGSQANLVKNEAAMDKREKKDGSVKKPASLSRTASRNSEFETVSATLPIQTHFPFKALGASGSKNSDG